MVHLAKEIASIQHDPGYIITVEKIWRAGGPTRAYAAAFSRCIPRYAQAASDLRAIFPP